MTTQRILTWEINSINQERQEIHRSINDGEFLSIATLDATTTLYVDTTEVANTSDVAYRIASVATINGKEEHVLSEPIKYVSPMG